MTWQHCVSHLLWQTDRRKRADVKSMVMRRGGQAFAEIFWLVKDLWNLRESRLNANELPVRRKALFFEPRCS